MNCEFLGLAWRDGLCQTTNILDKNCSLDLFFVDVVDGAVRDDKSALLGPLEHVCFLNLIGE